MSDDAATTPDLAERLAPGGAVARRLGDNYEARPQQVAMASAVDGALRNGQTLLAEAGTGVGKSFAYLLPAIEAAAKRKKRVVVSTHTIALQEQIVDKDVPLLRAATGEEFTAVLVKGRGNYLCLRRLDSASRRQSSLFASEQERSSLADLEAWASETNDGDVGSLPILPDMRVWEHARAEAGNCMGKRCRFFKACHWQAAKRRMQTANVLVVNHALFFSDLALRLAGVTYLPKYDHVVFDEAHTLEDAAATHFGLRVGEGGVNRSLRQLFDVKRTKGFLTTLARAGGDAEKVNELVGLVADAQAVCEGFFDRVLSWRDRFGKSNGRVRQEGFVEDDLSPALGEIAKRLVDLAGDVEAEEDNPEDERLETRLETKHQADKVRVLGDTIAAFVGQTMPDAVYWIDETGRTPRRASLHASPVDVGQGLKMALWDKTPGCVLTSATLATTGEASDDDGFGHVKQRLGLDADTTAARFGSPFNYREQCKLIVETGLPEPNDHRFTEHAADRIVHWCRHTEGGAFVLFTSHRALNATAHLVQDELEDAGLRLLLQGRDGQRRGLLDKFRSAENNVLFGTASFWQGVDVQGRALRNVILHKLPFAVPDEPVQQARIERIESAGGNGFMDYSVPEAVIKLRQGFGRLIRSGTDKGIIVLLDGRILTRRYGRHFLAGLPDVEVTQVDHRVADV
ncbi:MAG: helicase C-terminal domain-containing protein [Planctomycetota bacterium]